MITDLELGNGPAPTQPCPTAPFDAKYIYFYYGYKELALLYKRYALPLKQLTIEAGDRTKLRHVPIRTFTQNKKTVDDLGFVEDITKLEAIDTYGAFNRRAYLIQHSVAAGGGDPVFFDCGGNPNGSPPRRDCETEYLLEPGLIVGYAVRQDARDQPARHWQIPPAGSIREPEGLLDLDLKVRSLIRFFTSEP
jgi:hypothetical protein